MEKRVIRVPAHGARPVVRRPMASTPSESPKGGGAGKVIFLIVLLALLGGGGWLLYQNRDKFMRKPKELPTIIDPSLMVKDEPKPKPKPKVEEAPKKVEAPKPPPPPPKKSLDEIRAECDAALKEREGRIAAARAKDQKALPGFAGFKFGDSRKKSSPLRTETLPDGGLALVVWGDPLAKPLKGFSPRPLLWLTPKTRKIFRIEFDGELKASAAKGAHPDTAATVAMLEKRFGSAITVDTEKFPMVEREYFFPRGETTLFVGEYGGSRLKLVAESEKVRALCRGESEALHDETLAEKGLGSALGSNKYPNGGKVKIKNLRHKDGTPLSFCGVSFGTSAPYGAVFTKTAKGAPAFFLDYRKATKCHPFMNFTRGKAEFRVSDGAVWAVSLFSDGSEGAVSDAEFFDKVRKVLKRHYKVEPKEEKGEGAFPRLVYTVKDVEITLAPDPSGGFALRAVDRKLEPL